MHLEKLSNSILFHTKNHLAIRGNIQTRNEIISAFASDMADFLARKKDRRICSNEIIEFFKRHFPQLAVEVQKMDKSQREFFKNVSGCFVPIRDKDNNIRTFMLLLEDPSIIVKIKEKFNILENKKFRINPEFLNILVHESTHLMQLF